VSDSEQMRTWWDHAAEENPLWYVHSELDFGSPDVERFWRSGEEEVAAVLSEAGVAGGGTALDIGCGVGRLSRALASRFDRVVSFDVSPKMVELASRNLASYGNVTVRVAPGDGRLDVPDRDADLVFSLQVFQHIPLRDATLRYIAEAGRALRSGGRFVFQLRSLRTRDPLLGTVERGVRVVLERVRRIRKPPPESLDSPAWHGSRIGLWEIRRAAEAAGMRVVRTRWISKTGASLLVVCEKR
jgi:SAM-dependent methyltransferase